jgi:hypothetical protein
MNHSHRLDALLKKRPIPYTEIVSLLCDAANRGIPQTFESAKVLAHSEEDYIELIRLPAVAVLPAWGKQGVNELKLLVEKSGWGSAALSVLLCAANGQTPTREDVPFLPTNWDQICRYKVTEETAFAAQRAVRELMFDSYENVWRQSRILGGLTELVFQALRHNREQSNPSPKKWKNIAKTGTPRLRSKLDLFFRTFIDPRLNLNERQISKFQSLLESEPAKEEELQKFLFQHPIFLDPLALEVRSKHELGNDFITDFVVRRINNEYVVIEIEKSTDKLFTSDGNIHSNLNEALRGA